MQLSQIELQIDASYPCPLRKTHKRIQYQIDHETQEVQFSSSITGQMGAKVALKNQKEREELIVEVVEEVEEVEAVKAIVIANELIITAKLHSRSLR